MAPGCTVSCSSVRARDDQRPDSDYDIAVFLRNLGPLWKELDPLAAITTEILYDTGAIMESCRCSQRGRED
jgi:hypothetical protein